VSKYLLGTYLLTSFQGKTEGHRGDEHITIKSGSEDEYNVYLALHGLPGFQLCLGHFNRGGYHYLVLQATGPTIESLLEYFSRSSLSTKTVLMLMDQLIIRLEALHSRGFVHGGIRPSSLANSFREGGPIHLTGCPKRYQESAECVVETLKEVTFRDTPGAPQQSNTVEKEFGKATDDDLYASVNAGKHSTLLA
jgi:hypothetical protein